MSIASSFHVSVCPPLPRARRRRLQDNHRRDRCLTPAVGVSQASRAPSAYHQNSPSCKSPESTKSRSTSFSYNQSQTIAVARQHTCTTHKRELLHVRDERREISEVPTTHHPTLPHIRAHMHPKARYDRSRMLTCSWAPGTRSSGARAASHGCRWCG